MPEEVQEINVHSINLAYGDEFKIVKAGYDKAGKVIQLQLEGEQIDFRTKLEEGIKIVIDADFILRKEVADKDASISMKYTNENRAQAQYETNANVKLNSKYGAILYSNISRI